MRKHYIKIYQRYYDRVEDRQKLFEVRLNDRDYQVGDLIFFDVIGDDGKFLIQSARPFEIKYIHSGLGMADGYVLLDGREEKRILMFNTKGMINGMD